MSTKTGFKVVYKWLYNSVSIIYTYSSISSPRGIDYKISEKTIPEHENGPLAVFSSLEEAQEFK